MSVHTEIETKVIEVIRHELHANNRKLDGSTRLADLSGDSLALLKLTLTIEEAFDIEIPDEEADRVRTVQDAITAVETHLRTQRRG